MIRRLQRRRGAALVETAFVFPVLIVLMIGLIVGALGVFRYQEVASLAREGARYASVRGAKFAQTTGQPAATPDDVYTSAIQPKMVSLDPALMGYSVSWSPDNRQGSTVTCTVTYRWLPEILLGGINLSSTSVMPMSY